MTIALDKITTVLDRAEQSPSAVAGNGAANHVPSIPGGDAGAEDRAWRYVSKDRDAVSGEKGHNATYHVACELWRLLGDDDAAVGRVLARFNAEKCTPPWSERELQHKLKNARAEVERAGEMGSKMTRASGRRSMKQGAVAVGDDLCTELRNAERFAKQHGERVRHCHAWGKWLIWDGTRWAEDRTGEVYRLAVATVRSIYREAAGQTDNRQRSLLGEWARKSESEARIRAMVSLARNMPGIAVVPEALDAEPMLLNLPNGILDLKTGELLPHDPTRLMTKLAPIRFDPTAEAELWAGFLNRIFNGNLDLIGYVQRLLGMCLTGDIREQYLFIFHGEGANGKSTLLGTVLRMMGDYAGTVPDSLLTVGKRDEHPTEQMDLCGRRLAVGSETENNARLNVARVKKLTGEATIKARRMHSDYVEFPRTHKLILQTNNRPRISEDTEAVWRRIRLIPFNVTIPGPERDTLLGEKLWAEAPGILAWLVRGCLEWQRNGLGEPGAVTSATGHYREESNHVAEFVGDCCELGPEHRAASGAIRGAYETWCKEKGEYPMKGNEFWRRLEKLGAVAKRGHGGARYWQGIGLTAALFASAGEDVTP